MRSEIYSMQTQIEWNIRITEKLKIPLQVEQAFGGQLWWQSLPRTTKVVVMALPLKIETRDDFKPNTTDFEPIFNLNIFLANHTNCHIISHEVRFNSHKI